MLMQTKFIYLLNLVALMLQIQIHTRVDCTMSKHSDTLSSRLENFLHNSLTIILLNSLQKQGDKSNLRKAKVEFLPILLKKMNELRAYDEISKSLYWHSRQGR